MINFDQTVQVGSAIINNVEIYRGGQVNTYKSGIRFEGHLRGNSTVENSVVWGGIAKPLYIKTSKNISIKDTSLIGGYQFGAMIRTVTNVNLDGMFVADIKRRFLNPNNLDIDKEGGIALCSFDEGDKCYDSSITNSIVTGVMYGGYVVPGHDCGDTNTSGFKFYNNVAHSIDGSGAYIFPDPASSKSASCYEGSHFSAYKTREPPVTTHYTSNEIRMTNMVFIDNAVGLSLQIGKPGDDLWIKLSDTKIYGEAANINLDCPPGISPSCWCADKFGLMLFGSNHGNKALHPTMASALPIYKIKSESSWGTNVKIEDVEFINWKQ